MQSSGTCGPLSDGTRKTIVGSAPPKPAKPEPQPKPTNGGHRRGGFSKHAKGGK